MDEMQRAAYVISQAACLMAETAGMQAENQMRKHRGEAPAYCEKEFQDLILRSGMYHNAVVEYLRR